MTLGFSNAIIPFEPKYEDDDDDDDICSNGFCSGLVFRSLFGSSMASGSIRVLILCFAAYGSFGEEDFFFLVTCNKGFEV